MFLLVDKDGNGFVGFEEFLDLFQILSSGMVNSFFVFLKRQNIIKLFLFLTLWRIVLQNFTKQ
jgi:uncharacterized protein (DUF2235 family)